MSIETSIANVIRTREPRSLLTRVALRRRSCGTSAAPKISLAIRTKMAKSKMTRPSPEANFSHRSQLLIEASGVLASCNAPPSPQRIPASGFCSRSFEELSLQRSSDRLHSGNHHLGSIPLAPLDDRSLVSGISRLSLPRPGWS